jgi:hypothetical protein
MLLLQRFERLVGTELTFVLARIEIQGRYGPIKSIIVLLLAADMPHIYWVIKCFEHCYSEEKREIEHLVLLFLFMYSIYLSWACHITRSQMLPLILVLGCTDVFLIWDE